MSKKQLEDFDLVAVTWIDSYGCNTDWTHYREKEEFFPHYCYTVGWKIFESREVIVVAPHFGPATKNGGSGTQYCGEMLIHKKSIIEIKTLRVKFPTPD